MQSYTWVVWLANYLDNKAGFEGKPHLPSVAGDSCLTGSWTGDRGRSLKPGGLASRLFWGGPCQYGVWKAVGVGAKDEAAPCYGEKAQNQD